MARKRIFTGGTATSDPQTSMTLPKPLTIAGKVQTAKAKTTGGTGKVNDKKKPIKTPVIGTPTGTANNKKIKKAPKNLVKTTPSKKSAMSKINDRAKQITLKKKGK